MRYTWAPGTLTTIDCKPSNLSSVMVPQLTWLWHHGIVNGTSCLVMNPHLSGCGQLTCPCMTTTWSEVGSGFCLWLTHTACWVGIIVWGTIKHDSRLPVVHTTGTLTVAWYISKVLQLVLLPYLEVHFTMPMSPDTVCNMLKNFHGEQGHQTCSQSKTYGTTLNDVCNPVTSQRKSQWIMQAGEQCLVCSSSGLYS